MREDAADAGLVPMAPGIPHPAQVPARTCSSQHFPGAALPTTAFAQSRGYLSQCKLSWDWNCLGVREARNGAEVLIFCCWCVKYEQVQPRMLWCSAASGWMLDKSRVPAPQEAIFPRRAAFELLQVKT